MPWRDGLFWLAIIAAGVYWGAAYLLLGRHPDPQWTQHLLYGVLIYPVLEEVVFRGLLQDLAHRHLGALRALKLGPLSHANILVSLLFTGLHFIYHPPLWAASVLAPSLIFGLLKDRTGRLIAPILLHMIYNAGDILVFRATF
ncbi:MAG TPA: JDVT-CTERM system CAAX-type protease [Chromatiaceae bacterium]|nr:JDVT-CTERM system CAAX-type protease [Chromatiaceae bacterium]HIN81362.1 JDVT-CTERM system CAAX-type protease [Chromatiales bacterium]HIA08632.1 JDVT-CTERM system CAAX-type protease [Chromatiaceae bacterium]HIB83070.1 JDVT-CTERM system CAAX-type protease [Chromatiaceae bacterium]HIO14989.1 JDVT-CTERM system CAAX-type protease [Chromatiales bacterium]